MGIHNLIPNGILGRAHLGGSQLGNSRFEYGDEARTLAHGKGVDCLFAHDFAAFLPAFEVDYGFRLFVDNGLDGNLAADFVAAGFVWCCFDKSRSQLVVTRGYADEAVGTVRSFHHIDYEVVYASRNRGIGRRGGGRFDSYPHAGLTQCSRLGDGDGLHETAGRGVYLCRLRLFFIYTVAVPVGISRDYVARRVDRHRGIEFETFAGNQQRSLFRYDCKVAAWGTRFDISQRIDNGITRGGSRGDVSAIGRACRHLVDGAVFADASQTDHCFERIRRDVAVGCRIGCRYR